MCAAAKGNAYSPGRPPEYDPYYHDEQAKKLCLLGYTNAELSSTFRIAERTINRWLKDHESFCQAVHEGREGADAEVAASFFKRATGYTYPSEKVFQYEGDIIRAPVEAVVLPDPGAALNWLKNRQPDKWRDKIDLGLPPEIVVRMNLDGDTKPAEE